MLWITYVKIAHFMLLNYTIAVREKIRLSHLCFMEEDLMSSWLPSVATASRMLAYIHRNGVACLPKVGFPIADRRTLATWLDLPVPRRASSPLQPALAAHLTLLFASGLLMKDDKRWVCSATVFDWLQRSPDQQQQLLYQPLTHPEKWLETVSQLQLEKPLTIDQVAYLRQQAQKQVLSCEEAVASWHKVQANSWQLSVPANLAPHLVFHLLQIGDFSAPEQLQVTPLTVAAGIQRGYSVATIQSLLPEATAQPLGIEQMAQLKAWAARRQTYRVQPVYLLSSKQPEQLVQVAEQRRLREHFQEQLSPRHAIVKPELIPRLRRWLAKQAYPLDAPDETERQEEAEVRLTSYSYVGLKVLAGLGEFIELPLTLPADLLANHQQHLDPEQEAQLQRQADTILAGLRDAIAGRDAFFPAEHVVAQAWLETVHAALANETTLSIYYQSVAAHQPSWRQVQPLRLEERETLYYLYAYCYRAETNLTFRMDRIVDLREEI